MYKRLVNRNLENGKTMLARIDSEMLKMRFRTDEAKDNVEKIHNFILDLFITFQSIQTNYEKDNSLGSILYKCKTKEDLIKNLKDGTGKVLFEEIKSEIFRECYLTFIKELKEIWKLIDIPTIHDTISLIQQNIEKYEKKIKELL